MREKLILQGCLYRVIKTTKEDASLQILLLAFCTSKFGTVGYFALCVLVQPGLKNIQVLQLYPGYNLPIKKKRKEKEAT